ncbi:MAG: protein-L-isoaspartate(D-aspartate) O-methyltransferase [Planctomycetota bacterium]
MVKFDIARRTPREQSERVLDAMRTVPRHEFVLPEYRDRAYSDTPLPIGHDQTISQPYIVALMTDRLEPEADDRVLEVGTGSGYQAAVLSELCAEVYTVEIVEGLAQQARKRLESLGYDNVHVRHGDGFYGWEEHAPFDAIIVTAAPEELPQRLLDQLKSGGRMVIPVGEQYGVQRLLAVTKTEEGEIRRQMICPVRFVPMTGRMEKVE